jgi:hypothetical protein
VTSSDAKQANDAFRKTGCQINMIFHAWAEDKILEVKSTAQAAQTRMHSSSLDTTSLTSSENGEYMNVDTAPRRRNKRESPNTRRTIPALPIRMIRLVVMAKNEKRTRQFKETTGQRMPEETEGQISQAAVTMTSPIPKVIKQSCPGTSF